MLTIGTDYHMKMTGQQAPLTSTDHEIRASGFAFWIIFPYLYY